MQSTSATAAPVVPKAPGFKVEYTVKATGERKCERPYYVVSADGKSECLFLDGLPLVTLPRGCTSEELWAAARARVGAWTTEYAAGVRA